MNEVTAKGNAAGIVVDTATREIPACEINAAGQITDRLGRKRFIGQSPSRHSVIAMNFHTHATGEEPVDPVKLLLRVGSLELLCFAPQRI